MAWQKEGIAGRALDGCLAILGLIALEALGVTRRAAPPALWNRADWIGRQVPPILELRALGPDLGRLAEAITLEIYGRAG
jgi:histidine ammonia-lyase